MTHIDFGPHGLVEVIDWNQTPFPWPSESWPIAAAVLWVAWRTQEAVDREWACLVSDQTFSLDTPMRDGQLLSLRDAVAELWSALHAQKTQAHAAFGRAEQDLFIPPRHWTANLYFSSKSHTILQYNVDDDLIDYVLVSVPRARVHELWPEIHTPSADTVLKSFSEPVSRSKRGRPQTERGKNAKVAMQKLTDGELNSWPGEALASHLQISRTMAEEYRKREIDRRARTN